MTKPHEFLGTGHHSTKPLGLATLSALLTLALLPACGTQDNREGTATQSSSQSKVRVAKAMEDDPCALLPRQIVADQFSVPVEDIEQIAVSSTCQYDWKNKSEGLRADVSINIARIAEDAADAARYFDLATRSMSADEVSDAMGKVSAEAKARGLDNALTLGVTGGMGGKGIMFEDLSGLGDKARFQPAAGRVHVLLGNLYYEITAYHGPDMSMPDSINMEAIGKASAQWMQDTMPQRKDAAEQLARAVIANL